MSCLKAKTIVLHLFDNSSSISLETTSSLCYFVSTLSLLSYPFSEMAFRSNLGIENQLVVIIERLVDFREMMVHGFDLQSIISQNGWDGLFDMVYGHTYPNLIKIILGECIFPRTKSKVSYSFYYIWCSYNHHSHLYC